MKVIIASGLFLAFTSSAFSQDKPIDMMNQLHDGVCEKHQNPEVCKRVVGIIMKGVKHNDDIYIECQKNKPSTPEDVLTCQSASEVRSMIEAYN